MTQAAIAYNEQGISIAGTSLIGDPGGALYWPQERALVVADLHFEKGSSYARRGILLPPYDTAATLARLTALIMHYAPRVRDRARRQFPRRRRPGSAGGQRPRRIARTAARPRLDLDHRQSRSRAGAEYRRRVWRRVGDRAADVPPYSGRRCPARSPAICIRWRGSSHRGRAVSRRCFAADAMRMVMPAFGAYTGGLNVRDAAFADLFGTLAFTAHMLGDGRLYAFAARHCRPD